jgi:hypothetical protein
LHIDFTNISYLQSGTPLQQRAYNVLSEYGIMEKLTPYDPLLCGTIPINISVDGSDLDIICQWQNKDLFIAHLIALFSGYERFCIWENEAIEAVVASFVCKGIPVEIFGQDIPAINQNAYRHMMVEYKILMQHGETFRREIIALKEQGYKTEPAFAKLLALEGDPYVALLHYTTY